MKALLHLACLLPAFTGLLHAQVPQKPLPSKYRELWINSPFTAKPAADVAIEYNPLQDYVLLGVSPIEQGYRVTMINRKRPNDERIILESHRPVDGMKIIEVLRKEGDPLGTTVRISRSGKVGVIGFEEKFLALKAPQAPPANPTRPNNSVQPVNNDGAPPGVRVPRRRIIPPTSGGGQNQGADSSNTGVRTVPNPPTPPVPSGR